MVNYNEIRTLEGRIKELERRMSTAETAPRLSASSIESGSLSIGGGGSLNVSGGDIIVRGGRIRVQTPEGVDQVRMGLLTNGTYGVEQLVGGNWIPLHQIAQGAVSSGVYTDFFDFGSTAGNTSLWVSGTTPVSFTTYTGRVTLMATVGIVDSATWYGDKSTFSLGYEVKTIGGGVVIPPEILRSSSVSNTVEVSQNNSVLYIETFNIPPGDYVIDQSYLLSAGEFEDAHIRIHNRSLMVFPY